MNRLMWVDVETTGLDSYKNGIIQLSGFFEVSGSVGVEFDFLVSPFQFDIIDSRALEVNGRTMSEIFSFEKPAKVFQAFLDLLGAHEPGEEWICAGYNVAFDVRFLKDFFGKNGDKNFNTYFDYHILDVMNIAQMYCHKRGVKLPNVKLATVAQHFGISANFHNAMDDIRATRQVYYKILGAI